MELSDKVEDKKFIDSIMPKGMNLKEKVYFWTAQANATMLPFSILYTAFGDNPKAGAIATGINAVLAYGSIFAMKLSYNKRHGENAMAVDYSPGVYFFEKRL